MADKNIRNNNVAIGNTALAKIGTFLDGGLDDMETVQVVWKNQNGTTLSDETWSGIDVSTTGTNGETVGITDPTGTGNYEARLQIVSASWPSVPDAGVTGTVTITITNQAADGSGSKTTTFNFTVIPTNVSITLSTTLASKVRRLTGITQDFMHVAKNATDTTISFGSGIIHGIEAAKKNGDNIVLDTDYSWNANSPKFTLLAAPTQGDELYFRVKRNLDDATVEDYIDEAKRYINGQLGAFYAVGDVSTNGTYENLVIGRAAGRIKEDLSEGIALDSAHYRSGHDLKRDVDSIIQDIQRGMASLTDDDGSLATRTENAILGGFRHADGAATTRLDLLDRAQQTTGVYVQLFPEDIEDSPRSL